jgi:pimeloyl-ACP methyl ester carboxylesterase
VYWNWFKLDPWFVPRLYFRDMWHPRSPLSSTSLVHRAFFSPEYPVGEVKKFEVLMPEYESLVWPLGMMFSFVNVGNVLKSVVGWRDERQARVLIIAGEKDTLMGVGLMRKMAADYRQQFISFAKSLWGARFMETSETKPESGDQQGVGFEVIQGSGHHIQNDLHWEECAQKILAFVDQL